MKAILRKISQNMYEITYPIGKNDGLIYSITRKIQVLQGYWLVYDILESRGLIHSVFHNYRAFKQEFEKQIKTEIVREK